MCDLIKYCLVGTTAILGLLPAVSAQEAFHGKELRILVGYASGGGYDAYARAVAQHIGRFLPGGSTIVVQNMPGADGLTLANHMAQRAPRDGTVIGLTNRNLVAAPLLGSVDKASIQFDPAAFFWIANINVDTSVLAVRQDAGVFSLEDLKSKEIVVGATGLSSNNAIYPHVINNLLKTRIRVVLGYPGTSHIVLAMERGEIQGNGAWAWSSLKVQRPQWLSKGEVLVLLQVGSHRITELQQVPLITDLAKTESERRALELVFVSDVLGRPFFAPPQIPSAIGDLLRKGFAAMAKDAGFLETIDKAKLDFTFQDGAAVEAIVKRLLTAPADTVALARQLMQPARTTVEQLPSPRKQ